MSSIFLTINSKTLHQLFLKKKITVIEYNNFFGICENFNRGKGEPIRKGKKKGLKKSSSVGEHFFFRTLFARKFSMNWGGCSKRIRNFHDIFIPCPTQTQGTDKRDVGGTCCCARREKGKKTTSRASLEIAARVERRPIIGTQFNFN